MRPAVKVARIAGASRHSQLETEPTCFAGRWEIGFVTRMTVTEYAITLSITNKLRTRELICKTVF